MSKIEIIFEQTNKTMPSVLPLASSAIGLGLNIYNSIQAEKDRAKAQRSLDELSAQPFERYSVNPAISRYYQTNATLAANPYGYSQGERGNFTQSLNRILSGQRAYATNATGGNLGKVVNFMDVSPRIGALNDFASKDAGLRRSFQYDAMGRQFQGANVMQGIDNMNINAALARRMQALQAYGMAAQTNKDFVRNTIGGVGRDMITAGLMTTAPVGEVLPFDRFNSYKRGY